ARRPRPARRRARGHRALGSVALLRPATPVDLTGGELMTWTVIDSPVGELRIVARDGALTQIEFTPFRDSDGRPRGDRADTDPLLVEAVRQLRDYFAGDLKDFDLPLAPAGSAWQRAVWDQLLEIGYGETASYGEIAARLGKSNAASRAVGLANGSNPIPIV